MIAKESHTRNIQYWKEKFEECSARPENQTVMQWCNANGINVRRYYYWFKVVHSDLEETDQPELVEVKEVKEDSRPAAEAVIHIADGRIELSDSISGSLLHRIISELRHA